jgi:hypothetical protein
MLLQGWRRATDNLAHHARRHQDQRILRDNEDFTRLMATSVARKRGVNDLQTLSLRRTHAVTLRALGRFGEAEAEFADVVTAMTAVLGAGCRKPRAS